MRIVARDPDDGTRESALGRGKQVDRAVNCALHVASFLPVRQYLRDCQLQPLEPRVAALTLSDATTEEQQVGWSVGGDGALQQRPDLVDVAAGHDRTQVQPLGLARGWP